MTTIKKVLDADYWYMRGKKDAQKEFLQILINLHYKFNMYSFDTGNPINENYKSELKDLEKLIEELKKAVEK